MRTPHALKSFPGILLLIAGAQGLQAQVAGDPAPLPGVDAGSPAGAPPAFVQGPAPGADSNSFSPPGAESQIRRELTAREPGPWTAAQVTGAPNTLTMGDYSTAWAAASADAGEEWLSVKFPFGADLDRVRVVQSFNPGAITRVTAESGDGQQVVLEEAKSEPGAKTRASPEAVAKHARHRQQAGHGDAPVVAPVVAEFVLPAGAALRTNSIRITIDERKVPGWNEIDAVEIVSRIGARQWARAAKASSSFGDRVARERYATPSDLASPHMEVQIQNLENRIHSVFPPVQTATGAEIKGLPWSPEQATGAPDTPIAGDCPTAWAPLSYGGKEWLDVTFARPAEVREVRIVESSATHAITGAQAWVNGALVSLTIKKEEPVAISGTDPQAPLTISGDGSGPVPGLDSSAGGLSAPHIVPAAPENPSLPAVQKVRIELDSTGLTTWPEIDAVELVGTDGSRQWAARAEASSTYARHMSGDGIYSRGYRRANTLEDANQRIELLTRRLERLEQEVNKTKTAAPGGAAATEKP